jgi:hypothetical protein
MEEIFNFGNTRMIFSVLSPQLSQRGRRSRARACPPCARPRPSCHRSFSSSFSSNALLRPLLFLLITEINSPRRLLASNSKRYLSTPLWKKVRAKEAWSTRYRGSGNGIPVPGRLQKVIFLFGGVAGEGLHNVCVPFVILTTEFDITSQQHRNHVRRDPDTI